MLTAICLLILFPSAAICWDSDDFELFDLVEEVNANFYEFLTVEKDASLSVIKKAYRKQTLILHPDKNKAEDADEQFRKLVAVYDVLKDADKREKYNAVLENGLPDWRQPVFYYRRVRKLGILELAILLAFILTIGQYLVLWSIFIERKFTLEDNYRSKKKSDTNKRKAKINEEIEEELQEKLHQLTKPRILNLWPFAFTKWTVLNIIGMPTHLRNLKECYKDKQEQIRLEKEEKERELEELRLQEQEPEVKRPKRKPRSEPEGAPVIMEDVAPVVYGSEGQVEDTGEDEKDMQTKSGEWTDEEYVLLSKAYIKFPGGTTERWEKIAEMVGRPVSEVINKCKNMKGSYQMNLSSAVQGGSFKTSKKGVEISDGIISIPDQDYTEKLNDNENESTDNPVKRKNKNKPSKDIERTLMIAREPVQNSKETGSATGNLNETGLTSNITKTRIPVSSTGASHNGVKPPNKSAKPSHSETADKTPTADLDVWSQNQQVILEWALRQYPKTVEKRWEKIAEHIPGKSKEDCVARFKYLADVVKQRKQQS